MSSTTSTRRSQRLMKQKHAVQREHYRIQKTIPPKKSKVIHITTRSKSMLSKELDQNARVVKPSKQFSTSKANKKVSRFIADSASDSYDDTDMEGSDDESDDEYNESANLSADNIAFTLADALDRRESYDSRCESGNEDYELDDFVVGDDYETDSSSEVDTDSDSENDEEMNTPGPQRTTTTIKEEHAAARKISTTSIISSSSGLFVPDPNDSPTSLSLLGYPLSSPLDPPSILVESQYERYLRTPITHAAVPDIAEDITDAISLFSRRCNRSRTPLTLRLSSAVLADEEVSEALQTAEKLGLGQGLDLGDGTEGWVIGPRK